MPLASASSGARSLFLSTGFAPGLFVFLWSTGFIFTKLGLGHAEPFTFLLVRFAVVFAIMLPWALLARVVWPLRPAEIGHVAVVGLLMHGAYLGGVYTSIGRGFPAGLCALIAGLQPLLTATVVGPLLGERVSPRQWLGLVLGLVGVVMVLADKATIGEGGFVAVALAVVALIGITAGTLYQKRFCTTVDLRAGAVIQYGAAAIAMLAFATPLETMRIDWAPQFVLAFTYLSLVLSIGGVSLLYALIRRGAAAKIASLFYLVPPVTALMAFFAFGETLGAVALIGMGCAAGGVALVQRG